MQPVDTITRAFHYYYDPRTGKRITTPGNGEPWYVELSEAEYAAVGLLNMPGGFAAFMGAAFKCGFLVSQDERHTIGYCWDCGDDTVRVVIYDNKECLCRKHYAAKVAK